MFARLFGSSRPSTVDGAGADFTSAGREWLYENDFVVAEALETLDGALPARFLNNLPGLREPESQRGSPRAQVLAEELVRRGRGRVEVGEVVLFLEGYQEVRSLRLAELWALPAFLRLALLEDLAERAVADDGMVEFGPYILSLRTLAGEDWRGVVESLSLVDGVLREDPAAVYAKMDFRTRDRYRRGVEKVARLIKQPEDTVARQALELARSRAGEPRRGHVGYYLVDEGVVTLIHSLGGRAPITWIPSDRRRLAGSAYLGVIAVLTLVFLAFLNTVLPLGAAKVPILLLALVPALGTAVGLMNRLVGQFVGPRTLPRLDVRDGIPKRCRTVVAVPVLLGSGAEIESILHNLETNYQANSDPALSFALLTDFPDSSTRRTQKDGSLLAAAAAGIRELNRKYERDGQSAFLLVHRPRLWNPSEECWMGWERKRGKLAELNQMLLGNPTSLWVVEGEAHRLKGAPFVLTVDADTRLPRDSAARLVGTLAHPLNRPEIGPRGRITRGYSVLQPRIEILPDADGGTAFSRVYGGVEGLDLYAHAAFDVYQDLFDVGIFAGKGIYDVEAFEASLAGRTPENSLLSHDLFEGAHGRAGLVADLILLEDFPTHPLAYARRAHRWMRGDWQLLPWLFPRVPAERGERRRNPLSLLSRWMILDNLRRSVQPPAILGMLILGWALVPALAWGWTLGLAAVVGLPFLTGSIDAALRGLKELPRRVDLEAELRGLRRALGRWAMDLTFLPFESWNHCDAIVRTLGRVYFSRRQLLEWTTAAVTARAVGQSDSLGSLTRQMWVGPVLAAMVASGLMALDMVVPWAAMPFLTLWLFSPVVAYWVRRPGRPLREPRGEFPRVRARVLARRVWAYYERFQGPERHWLPPDHFQEAPGAEVAERTSPTNLGMALISAVTAWDLGFVGTAGVVTRIRNTVDGMRRLTRYRGHFLNWYDTSSLEPLHPLYVSTVDSGNLAASFVVSWEALGEAATRELWAQDGAEGLVDTLRVVGEMLREARQSGVAQALQVEVRALEMWMTRNLGDAWGGGLASFVSVLEELRDRKLSELETNFLRIHEEPGDSSVGEEWGALHAWLGHLRADVERMLDEILLLLPWLSPRFREHEVARRLHLGLMENGSEPPSLRRLESYLAQVLKGGSDRSGRPSLPEELDEELKRALETARLLRKDISDLIADLDEWFREMDFTFLYDGKRDLFRIGFSVSTGELDPNHYDLLASEARIASVVAMSKGDAPPAHWLHLGRPFAWTDRGPVLLSWAGTMFEYLMPTLFLRLPPETVLEEACRRAVNVQRDYGKRHRVPWGISESGYHALSKEGHYQYRAFGVPALGLSRVLGSRLVVAPYASLMAVSFAPGEVSENLEALGRLDGIGPWGPYEALDFGPSSERTRTPRVVRSYMSHHQGMVLAALGNHLTGHRHVERFHRDSRVRTIEPYLYERIPWRRSIERTWVDRSVPARSGRAPSGVRSWAPPVRRLPPPVHHITSGEFVVAVGADGRGGSRWGDWSVVRGGVGAGVPVGGPDVILLDRDTGEAWRPLPDPQAGLDEDQEVLFEPHRAEFMRRTRGIRVRMGLLVPPEMSVEIRELTLSNESAEPRHLRLAMSAELALAPVDDDLRHPAFQKLFVRAEALPGGEGLLFERRPRSPDESPPVVLVSVLGADGETQPLRWETSREVFVGRGGRRDRPVALDNPELLNPPPGPHHPLDPIAAAVIDLELGPWDDATFTLLIAVGPDRETVIRNASELRFPRRREWAEIQARARAEGELIHLGAVGRDPIVWEELLSHVLHPRGMERIGEHTAATLDLKQSSLWRWGISGDLPFILVEGQEEGESTLLPELLRAQRWWRNRGELVDIVVVSRGAGEYQSAVRQRVTGFFSGKGSEIALGQPGGVHIVRGDEVGDEERVRLRTLAAFRLDVLGGSLRDQIATARPTSTPLPSLSAVMEQETSGPADPHSTSREGQLHPKMVDQKLALPSALGGFDRETGDYLVDLGRGVTTPAPWVNIVAREGIGFLVTESGGSFTWVEDAGEFRLTPWHNDPVLGLGGEVLYLRDEETREVWTPFPGFLGRERDYRVRHGWGRTVLEASSDGLDEEVSWSLHPDLPVKVVQVRLRNRGPTLRRLSVTFFVDWVLGVHPSKTAGRLQIRFDPESTIVLARNPYGLKRSDKRAFLAVDGVPDGMATDRDEFLGPSGPLDRIPAGLLRDTPGERVTPRGRGCGVLKRNLTLAPGEDGSVTFFLGAIDGPAQMKTVLSQLRSTDDTVDVAEVGHRKWEDYLGRVRVRTPEAGLDCLLNGWLPYQTLVSRLWGRTGFYQSGGAFGFRDQLQDVYTLLPLDPSLAVGHLEEAARRQFREGDVLHWWHPGTTQGVRTRCSDDLLWLPWVLAQTVRWTGDLQLLDRRVPFLDGEPAPDSTDELYDAFLPSDEEVTLWEHGLRAVEHTARLLSPRGLPLMGSGDWNDGMDRVGGEGRGESVWLGWFFLDVCRLLIPLARIRAEDGVALRLEDWSATVREAIESYGWDGEWYRRAFFDSGEPLGARESAEARIDSIAQSWSVISEAADPVRARCAIDSAWRELVRSDDGIVLLLSPPFTGNGPDPGYIAAYPPGVRENGGQYTHAAAWLVRALARMGDGDRAGALLKTILPTRHSEGEEGTFRYRVEPYVIAADVYGAEPHIGRGGWTWYTGSAGWIWRVALEDVLGVRREGAFLRIDPCIPSEWDSFEVEIQVEGVRVVVQVRNPEGVCRGVRKCTVGGSDVDSRRVRVLDEDRRAEKGGTVKPEREMKIEVILGTAVS